MTEFSLEPTRKHLVVHHTFDFRGQDRAIDTSPQRTDGRIIGDVTFGHTGVIGGAARMESDDADVTLDAATRHYPTKSTTLSGWSMSDRPVPADEANVQSDVTVGGTVYKLSHTVDEPVDGWQFAAMDYDNVTARLYYARLGDVQPKLVDSVEIRGDVEDTFLEFNTNGFGFVDDSRMYRRNIGEDSVNDLYQIGLEQTALDEIAHAWSNDGMPFIVGEGNARLAGVLAEQDAHYFRQLDAVLEARHIGTSSGGQLDRLGKLVGVRRKEDEDDFKYRARISSNVIASQSSGTIEDVLSGLAAIVDTEKSKISLSFDYDAEPGTVNAQVRQEDLENSELTTTEISNITEKLVPGAHRIDIEQSGENPFTFISDTGTNDPKLGLTSDTTTDGGGLVSTL